MRTREKYEPALMRDVAKWHYDDHLSHPKINEKLRERLKTVSNRTAGNILRQAREDGIVRIIFPETQSPEQDLETRLKDKYRHLEKVIVVPLREDEGYRGLLVRWAKAAANYFEEAVHDLASSRKEVHVGISGGETLFAFANAVQPRARKKVHIHTTALIGRGRYRSASPRLDQLSHIDPLVNATILWKQCGSAPGRCHYATVPPPLAITKQGIASQLSALATREAISNVLDEMDNVELAFAGLGIFSTEIDDTSIYQLTVAELLDPIISSETLQQQGVFGDLAYSLFGRDGKSRKEWQFFLTAGYEKPNRSGIEFYRDMVRDKQKVKRVVVIAGKNKEQVVLTALKAGFFNVWITDDATARWVLEQL